MIIIWPLVCHQFRTASLLPQLVVDPRVGFFSGILFHNWCACGTLEFSQYCSCGFLQLGGSLLHLSWISISLANLRWLTSFIFCFASRSEADPNDHFKGFPLLWVPAFKQFHPSIVTRLLTAVLQIVGHKEHPPRQQVECPPQSIIELSSIKHWTVCWGTETGKRYCIVAHIVFSRESSGMMKPTEQVGLADRWPSQIQCWWVNNVCSLHEAHDKSGIRDPLYLRYLILNNFDFISDSSYL